MTSPTPTTQDATPPVGRTYQPNANPTVLVIALVAVIIVVIAAVVGLSLTGTLASTTPLLSTLLAFIAPVLLGLLTLLKVDRTGQQTAALTNGLLDSKVQNAVRAVLNEAQTPGTGDRPSTTLYTPDGDGPNATTVTPPAVEPVQPPAPTSPTSPAGPTVQHGG